MENQEARADSATSLTPYWQERPVKYAFPNSDIVVEEVRTPWDIFSEGSLLSSPIASEFHQILVKNGIERIFSIRTLRGDPFCEILTRPVNAPIVSVDWAPYRGLNTSSPMTIDGQKLVVLDVIGFGARRMDGPLMELAKDFFKSQGGVLRDEHPNGLVFSDPKVIKHWQAVTEKQVKVDLMISSKFLRNEEVKKYMRPHTAHAPNLELALLLLATRYWHRVYLNGDEEWIEDVVAHMEKVPDDQPQIINMCGRSDHAKELFARVKEMFEKGAKK